MQPIGPPGVGRLNSVLKGIEQGGDLNVQVAHATLSDLRAAFDALGNRKTTFCFSLDFICHTPLASASWM
jgi:hypothetical protein